MILEVPIREREIFVGNPGVIQMTGSHAVRLAVVTAALLLFPPVAADAGVPFRDSSTGRQVVLGIGTGLTSMVYTPVKFFYAAGATVTGGIVLAISGGEDADTAVRVVRRGTGGDWFVHPDVFTGHRKLRFNGEV